MGRLEEIPGTNIIMTPKGEEIRLGHTWHEVDVLKKIIKTESHKNFIEIGVHEGGLSYLLMPYFRWHNYVGIEIDLGIVQPAVKARYTLLDHDLVGVNCFEKVVLDRIAQFPNKIIYCDGGNKVAELHAYKEVCRSGDLLLTHDYYDGVRVVTDVYDPHAEVRPEDVADIDADTSFQLYDQQLLSTTRIQGWRKL